MPSDWYKVGGDTEADAKTEDIPEICSKLVQISERTHIYDPSDPSNPFLVEPQHEFLNSRFFIERGSPKILRPITIFGFCQSKSKSPRKILDELHALER